MHNEQFCQSCGMPMSEDEMFGKNADGSKNDDYCCYCYPNGAFNNPSETVEEMIESCILHVVEAGICKDADGARKMLSEHLPGLKRWAV